MVMCAYIVRSRPRRGFVRVFAAPTAYAAGVSLQMDQAQVLTFQRPIKTILVGNPLIADVTVIDPRHAFVLGKAMASPISSRWTGKAIRPSAIRSPSSAAKAGS